MALMKGTKKLGENEDWEACESTLQIGHIFSPNGVLRDYYEKGSKLTLWWQEKTKLRRIILRRLTAFYKLAMF